MAKSGQCIGGNKPSMVCLFTLLVCLHTIPVGSADEHVLLVNTEGHGSKILVTNRADREVTVNVITLQEIPWTSFAKTDHVRIPPRNSRVIEAGQDTSSDKVLLETDGEVSVAAVSLGSCSAYLSLPTTSLGTAYRALTWYPQTPSMKTSLSVLSLETNNRVTMTFRIPSVSGSSNAVTHNGQTYRDGDILVINLKKYESLRLEASADLSGTLIESEYKVIVFNGNLDVGIEDPLARDDTSSQVPPIFSWGTAFYALPSPDDIAGASIGIVTHEAGNVVYVSGITSSPTRYDMTAPGQVVRIEVPAGLFVSLRSEKPIMVSYFTKGNSAPNSPSYPSALLLPPAEQFLSSYDFSTVMDVPGKDFDSYLFLVIRDDQLAGLTLDGTSLSSVSWTAFASTSPTMVGRAISLTDGTHWVTHSLPGVIFGAYVLGFSRGDCTYAFPAGMALRNIYQVGSSSSTPSSQTTFQTTKPSAEQSTFKSPSTTFKVTFPPTTPVTSPVTSPVTFPVTSPGTTFQKTETTFQSTKTSETPSPSTLKSTTFKVTEIVSSTTTTATKSTETSTRDGTTFKVSATTQSSSTSPSPTSSSTVTSSSTTFKRPDLTTFKSTTSVTTASPTSFSTVTSSSTTFKRPDLTTFKSTTSVTTASPGVSLVSPNVSSSPTTFMTLLSGSPARTSFASASPNASATTITQSTSQDRTTLLTSGEQSSVGQRFFLTFPDASYNPEDILVLVTAVQPGPFRIRVFTRPGVSPSIDRFYDFVQTPNAEVVQSIQVKLPPDLRMSGVGRWRQGVLLISEKDITVTVTNKGSCAAYLALPNAALSTVYYALTWHTSYPGQTSQLTVTATEEDTTVALTISRHPGVKFEFEGETYRSGDRLLTKLARYESIHVEEGADLTGTYIVSDKPVAVLSGNSRVTIGRAFVTDTTVTQLPPVSSWGTQFAFVPIPGDQVGGFIKFVTSEFQTTVQVSGGLDFRLSEPGDFAVQAAPPGIFLSVTSNRPILAVFFASGQDGTDGTGRPASLLLPPQPQWPHQYWFTTLTDDLTGFYETYALVVANEQDALGLMLDDTPISRSGWVYIPGPPPQKVGKAVPLMDGAHSLRHETGSSFLVMLHGFFRGSCAYALPAGMNVQSINMAATTAQLPSITMPASTTVMSTQLKPVVPTTSFDGQDTHRGTDFFITFEENPPNTKPVKLMITTGLTKHVTVKIFTPPGFYPYFDLAGLTTQYQTTVVDLPGDVRFTGSGIVRKGVRVVATDIIAVSVLNLGSCSSYLGFEAPAMGLEYFVMTHTPSGGQSRATMTITAVTRGMTMLKLTLPPSAGTLILGGFNINNITLFQYESFRLSVAIDLTGVRVSASSPVTVRASTSRETIFGQTLNSDIAVTQLPPITSYGTGFYIFFVDAEVKLLSDFDDVLISVTRFVRVGVNPKVSTLTITKAGLAVSVNVRRDEFVTFMANGPLLAVAYLKTEWPASMLLPPIQQYLPFYYFTAAPDSPGSAFQSFLYIAILPSKVEGLRLDGVPVDPLDRIDAYQISGFKIPVSAGSHKIEHLAAISFAAYIIGTASNDCSYAYPAGLGLEEVFKRSTPDNAIDVTPSTLRGLTPTEAQKTPSTPQNTSSLRPATPSISPASPSVSLSVGATVFNTGGTSFTKVSTANPNVTPSTIVGAINPSVTPSTKVSAANPSATSPTISAVTPSTKVSVVNPSVTPSTILPSTTMRASVTSFTQFSPITSTVSPSASVTSTSPIVASTSKGSITPSTSVSSSVVSTSAIFTPSTRGMTPSTRGMTPSTGSSRPMTPSTGASMSATPSTRASGKETSSQSPGSTSMRPIVTTLSSATIKPTLSATPGTMSTFPSAPTTFPPAPTTFPPAPTTFPPLLTTDRTPPVFKCPSDGNYPLPGECDWYLECEGPSKTMLKCPNGLLFSPRDLVCLPEDQADCLDATPDSLGKEYILTFIAGSSSDGDIGLLITTAKPYVVYVTVSADGVPAASRQLTVHRDRGATVKLPAELLLPNSIGYLQNAVVVKSTAEMSVVAISRGSCAAVLTLPTTRLGTEYYTVNWWEENSSHLGKAGISISSVFDNTHVMVTLPACMFSSAVVLWDGQEYICSQSMELFLNKQKSFYIAADGDLSGTRILANKPVAVFSGNSKTMIGNGSIADNVLVQVPPTDTWGVSHIATAVPGDSAGGYIRIVARRANTLVVSSRGHYIPMEEPGDVVTIQVDPGESMVIHSMNQKQILAVYFTASGLDSPARVAPAALLLPPRMQWDDKYHFSTLPVTSFNHSYEDYVIIVTDMKHKDGILLDDKPLLQAQWMALSPTLHRALMKAQVKVSSGQHTLRHAQNETFMAYVYGSVHDDCSYAFPAGSKLLNITKIWSDSGSNGNEVNEGDAEVLAARSSAPGRNTLIEPQAFTPSTMTHSSSPSTLQSTVSDITTFVVPAYTPSIGTPQPMENFIYRTPLGPVENINYPTSRSRVPTAGTPQPVENTDYHTPQPHGENTDYHTPQPHGENTDYHTPQPHGENTDYHTPQPHGENTDYHTPQPHGLAAGTPQPMENVHYRTSKPDTTVPQTPQPVENVAYYTRRHRVLAAGTPEPVENVDFLTSQPYISGVQPVGKLEYRTPQPRVLATGTPKPMVNIDFRTGVLTPRPVTPQPAPFQPVTPLRPITQTPRPITQRPITPGPPAITARLTTLPPPPPVVTPRPVTPAPNTTPQPETPAPQPSSSPSTTTQAPTPATSPTVSTIGGCTTCDFLQVRSRQFPNIRGEYFLIPNFNDRVAYAQTSGLHHLYFLSLQTEFWIFGRSLGDKTGSVMSATIPYVPAETVAAQHPMNVIMWITIVDGQCTWAVDPNVQVQCTCQPAQSRQAGCRRVSLTADDKTYNIGNFTATNQVHLGRTVYRHDRLNFFLFFLQISRSESIWMVGPVVGRTDSIAFIASTAVSLIQVQGIWSERVHGIWTKEYQLKITCYP